MDFLTREISRIRSNKELNTVAQYLYLKMGLIAVRCDEREPLFQNSAPLREGLAAEPRVAFLCDEMTWLDFSGYANSIFLHPRVWKKQLEQFRPKVFFCESAWVGINAFRNVWRGRVYRDHRVPFENRDILLKILAYCRNNGIITVFWSKEDPAYFQHEIYDFTDTALQFDHVFTTAVECIERYRELGHQSVHLLPFGVNTDLFYPAGEKPAEKTALFAGSWFGDHPKRCEELENLLDYALAQGWALDIFDRNSNAPEERFRFPEKYTPYLHPAVEFMKMPELCRRYTYAINVNTVVDSPTMISRRVLQLAASGVTIVSNKSHGFDALNDCLQIWQESEKDPLFAKGIPQALEKHSTRNLFRHALETIEVEKSYTELV